jgi:hypothetical protein
VVSFQPSPVNRPPVTNGISVNAPLLNTTATPQVWGNGSTGLPMVSSGIPMVSNGGMTMPFSNGISTTAPILSSNFTPQVWPGGVSPFATGSTQVSPQSFGVSALPSLTPGTGTAQVNPTQVHFIDQFGGAANPQHGDVMLQVFGQSVNPNAQVSTTNVGQDIIGGTLNTLNGFLQQGAAGQALPAVINMSLYANGSDPRLNQIRQNINTLAQQYGVTVNIAAGNFGPGFDNQLVPRTPAPGVFEVMSSDPATSSLGNVQGAGTTTSRATARQSALSINAIMGQ